MTLWIFVACLCMLVLALLFDYIRFLGRYSSLSSHLFPSKAMQREVKENERRLRDELSDVKSKLEDAYTDRITGLPAWPVFEEKIKQSLNESERHQLTLGLVFVDIDDFSVINDAVGSKYGDELLREVTTRLQASIRQVDSMARFAKDTFVLLLNQLAKPETAVVVAQRIHQTMDEPIIIGEHTIHATVCIGIALFPADGKDIDALLRNADQALHLARQKGKRTSQFYEERIHRHSQRELMLYNSLSSDNVYNELLLYFQPIYENNKKIFCMEAVLYWSHPELGVILAEELFEFAERQKKLNEFSTWLLKKSCQEFLSWRNAQCSPPLLGLPLSIKQLENSQFIYHLSQAMQDLKFDPSWLLVVIKDDFSKVSLEIVERAFNMLNYLGVKLALTDFGATSFSLRYLKNFKIDYLLLENALIDDVVMNQRTQVLIRSLVTMAKSVSSEVVVKGVESDKQYQILSELGVTFMQGPWLGQAILARDVLQKIVVS